MLTPVELCSQALVLIGAQPIASFSDGTTEAVVASQLYEATAQDMLTRHRWRFATRQRQLQPTTLAEDGLMPDDRWTAFYQLPVDCLLVHGVTVRGFALEYDRQRDLVLTNTQPEDEVVLIYSYRAPESTWPPYFDAAMRFQLASIFALSVANRETLAESMERAALRQMAAARNIDSQSRTTGQLDVSRIVRARRTIGV